MKLQKTKVVTIYPVPAVFHKIDINIQSFAKPLIEQMPATAEPVWLPMPSWMILDPIETKADCSALGTLAECRRFCIIILLLFLVEDALCSSTFEAITFKSADVRPEPTPSTAALKFYSVHAYWVCLDKVAREWRCMYDKSIHYYVFTLIYRALIFELSESWTLRFFTFCSTLIYIQSCKPIFTLFSGKDSTSHIGLLLILQHLHNSVFSTYIHKTIMGVLTAKRGCKKAYAPPGVWAYLTKFTYLFVFK